MKVRPEIFRWLRESAGYSIEEISKILNVDTKIIKKIEDSNKEYEDIRLSWLRKLSSRYKRQLACFFLPEVPEDEKNILTKISNRHYRYSKQEPITIGTEVAKKLLLADRRARYLRSIIQVKDERREEPARYRIIDDPEESAKRERIRYKLDKITFESMRNYIESYCIYVFQFNLPLDVIRGFTLTDEKPYIIVVNSKDSKTGKLFTLIHEYAHILLRESSYCNTNEDLADVISDNNKNVNVEVWCNRFAAEFLMPGAQLLSDIEKEKYNNRDIDDLLNKLSKTYNVSRYALAVRLLNIGPKHMKDILRNKLDDIIREAEEYKEGTEYITAGEIEGEEEEKEKEFIFIWESIPIERKSKLKEYNRLYSYLINKLKRLENIEERGDELTIRRVKDNNNDIEMIKVLLNDRCIARIKLETKPDKRAGLSAKLIIEGTEKDYMLDVKKRDNKHYIYKAVKINIINKRKSELGSTYIDNLIELYNNGEITLYELADYLDLKINKVKTLLANQKLE